MKLLLDLVPILAKIAVVVALLSAAGLYIDNLCNSEKRSLRSDAVKLKDKIKSKNDTILELTEKIKKIKNDSKNENFNTKMECRKEIRIEHEDPHIDDNGNLYF